MSPPLVRSVRRRLALPALLLLLSALPARGEDADLEAALAAHDTAALLARFRELATQDEIAAAREIPAAVGRVELDVDGYHPIDRHKVFTGAIAVLVRLRSSEGIEQLGKSASGAKEWPARAVALQAGIQIARADGIGWSIGALRDEVPEVVIVAARALGHSQEILAIDPLITTMARWEKEGEKPGKAEKPGKSGKGGKADRVRSGRKALEADAAGRAWLACRDALHRLTGESMHTAQAYRTFYDARRTEIDPKKVDLSEREEDRTGVGLFGLELSGRNIAFILDISGSMVATDPLTPEQLEKLRRSTGVAGKEHELEQELLEERRRILRAKKELRKVVEGLGEDRNFNLIAYSTEVSRWQEMLAPADEKRRSSAIAFIEALEADGITVTDLALQEALSDPRIDTIYLITDGAPTHVGLTGPGLPPDAKELMERILVETKAMNHLRGVRIFTLGFEGAEEEFLEQLSAENGGRYVRIR